MEDVPESSDSSEVITDIPGDGSRPDCECEHADPNNDERVVEAMPEGRKVRDCRGAGCSLGKYRRGFDAHLALAVAATRRKSTALEGVAYEEYDALFGDPARRSAAKGSAKDNEAHAGRGAQGLGAAHAAAAAGQAQRATEEEAALEAGAAQERIKREQEAAQEAAEAAEAATRGKEATAAQKAAVAAEAAERQRKAAAARKRGEAAEA
eukprot:gene32117-40618_t